MPAEATIYKSVDAKGNVVYTDKPSNSSEKVELKPLTTYTPPARTRKLPPPPTDEVPVTPELSIVSPANGQTIWDNLGNISMEFQTNLEANEGNQIQVLLDGKPVAMTNEKSVQLQGIDRGEHTLVAEVIGPNGQVLATSNSVIVYLHRTIVKQNRPSPIR